MAGLNFKIDVKMPKLEIKTPSNVFWEKTGLNTAKEIRIRTETKGEDVDGKRFRPYSPQYRKFRVENGRSGTPNLSYSGRMLGSMVRGIRSDKDKVVIQLSGEEGGKAFKNEERGRVFFDVSEEQANKLAKDYLDSIKL